MATPAGQHPSEQLDRADRPAQSDHPARPARGGPALGIVADDLSGAGDSGLQFAKRGLRTVALLEVPPAVSIPGGPGEGEPAAVAGASVVVLDTDSRQAPAAEAARRVRAAVAALRALGTQTIYKKVDSTLRGNLGAELDALLDALPGAAALLAPAFPATGRTVVGGRVLLRGVPLEQSDFARDPLWPARDAAIAAVLARQSRRRCATLPLATVRQGPAPLAAAAERLRGEGVELCVADAASADDLAAVAAVLAGSAGRWVGVGSAGLAEELPAALGLVAPPGESAADAPAALPAPATAARERPVLLVVGSINPVTRRQLAVLARPDAAATDGVSFGDGVGNSLSITVAALDLDTLLAGGSAASATVATAAERLRAMLLAGRDAALALEAVVPGGGLAARAAARGLDTPAAAARAVGGLGAVVAATLRPEVRLAGLVLTGGDTAKGVCRALGARGVLVEREVAPGIPQGRLLGGAATGLPVVTKAGGFGGPAALVLAVRFLRSTA